MPAKADPSTLPHQWELRGGFELTVVQEPTSGRAKRKLLGTVIAWHDTEKGQVDNKRDQVLCHLHTSKQEPEAAPYALQASKLDWSALSKDLLKEVKKVVTAQSTLIQISRKSSSFGLFRCVSLCSCHRATKVCTQEVDGCQQA